MQTNPVNQPFGRQIRQNDAMDSITGLTNTGQIISKDVAPTGVLLYQPVADFSTGPLFPGSMAAKVDQENTLRSVTVAVRGKKQLFLDEMDTEDSYANRQVLPYVWDTNPVGTWKLAGGGKARPFKGYPNDDIQYLVTDVVYPSHYGNIDNYNLSRAINATQDFSKDYEKHVGAILRSDAGLGLEGMNPPVVVPSDGMGIQNPDSWKHLQAQYDLDHKFARNVRMNFQEDNLILDNIPGGPSLDYVLEQSQLRSRREGIHEPSYSTVMN